MNTHQTIIFSLAIAVISPLVQADIFVDQNISSVSCTTYQSATRSCGGGSQTAYRTLSGAANAATPGETVSIRAGTYKEQLAPVNSGKDGSPIIYENYQSETVTISGALRPAVDLSNRSFITIQGLTVENVDRWLYLVNAEHNVIANNSFRNATDSGGGAKTGIFILESNYNKVINNLIEDNANDSLSMIKSQRNLIEGNTFRDAAHALWDIRCGHFNVLRSNYFYNSRQKIGEVYDCDGQAGIFSYDDTKHNLIEQNEFAYTPSSGDSSPYSGIQYAGQSGLIRNNLFHRTTGPGLRMTIYGAEAKNNYNNRVVHNTFVGSKFAGTALESGDSWYDNVFKNNIFANSQFVANDTRWSWWVNTVESKPVQVKTSRLNGFMFDTNAFYSDGSNLDWLFTCGGRDPCSGWSSQQDISWWEDSYPSLIRNSIISDPGFENAESSNFQLSNSSSLIDQGTYLTTTTSAGSGTVLSVVDAGYFYDGFGISGENGDEIQLANSTQKAYIVAVDYSANTITVDRALNWSANQGIAYAYNGSKPDLGAFENGARSAAKAPPSPPVLIQ